MIFVDYFNFDNIFFDSIMRFLKYINNNNHFIAPISDRQFVHSLIYSLGLVEP